MVGLTSSPSASERLVELLDVDGLLQVLLLERLGCEPLLALRRPSLRRPLRRYSGSVLLLLLLPASISSVPSLSSITSGCSAREAAAAAAFLSTPGW